jgi:hypothetical protein
MDQQQQLNINIFTFDLVWMGTVDKVESFTHRISWHEIPTSSMSVPKEVQGVEELEVGRILVINNQLEKALIIEDIETSLDDQYIDLTLLPLKGMLNYRIAHPTDSANGLSWVERYQSQVMTWLCYDNVIKQTRDTDRYFWDAAKTKNLLNTASPTKAFGDIIDFAVDWETGYIGDAIITVSKMYGVAANYPLGWNIYIKPDYSGYEFDTYHGTHKHINQTTNAPVVFSEEYGNIKTANYTYSIKEWRNVAYMIYEGTSGEVVKSVGNTANGATIGFNRKEVIIKSSKKVEAEVVSEGYSELNKRPHIESFTAEIINNPNTMTTFGTDWTLGDIVTIQSKTILKDRIVSVDAMVTEVEEVYSAGEYTINATFGEGKLSLLQLIKNDIAQK